MKAPKEGELIVAFRYKKQLYTLGIMDMSPRKLKIMKAAVVRTLLDLGIVKKGEI